MLYIALKHVAKSQYLTGLRDNPFVMRAGQEHAASCEVCFS